jgi:hypothetical protein
VEGAIFTQRSHGGHEAFNLAGFVSGVIVRSLIHPPSDWLEDPSRRRVAVAAAVSVGGLALYGFSVGYWRSPLMGCYVAVKLPLLVFLTLGFNGLLNGLLGMLLGTGLGFRQSWLALLSSFSLAALMLGSLAPVTWLLAWNAPAPDSEHAASAHAAYLVAHTVLIGTAGLAANLHLHRQLAARAPSHAAAVATLLAWLGGNGFLGAQFSWVLRPFFGSPGLKVEFLREDALEGTFYETLWNALEKSTGGNAGMAVAVLGICVALPVIHAMQQQPNKKTDL